MIYQLMNFLTSHYTLVKYHPKNSYNCLLFFLAKRISNSSTLSTFIPEKSQKRTKIASVRLYSLPEKELHYLILYRFSNSATALFILSFSSEDWSSVSRIFLKRSAISLSILRTALLCARRFCSLSFSYLSRFLQTTIQL